MQYELFIFVLLWATTSGFLPPNIETDHELQSDSNGNFIELDSGTDLKLFCTHPESKEVIFTYPNLTDHLHYDPVDYGLRKVEKATDWGLELKLTSVKSSDTGLYSCHVKEDTSLVTEIYVYVKGDSLFIPYAATAMNVPVTDFIVPCRTTSHVISEQIELEVEGEPLDDIADYYHPSVGFKFNSDNVKKPFTHQMPFKCISLGNPEGEIAFLIGPKKQTDVSELEFKWHDPMPFPYVGGEFTLNCVLERKDRAEITEKYKQRLNVTCPRCGTPAVIGTTAIAAHMTHTIVIKDLKPEDSGEYRCNWFREDKGFHKLEDTIAYNVSVSPTKGQIKTLNSSPQKLTIKEGESFSLFANLTGFPIGLPGFTAKWIKRVLRPPKESPDTETMITDADHQFDSERHDNLIIEKLKVKHAKTNMSGTYMLNLEMLDAVKTIEYDVQVAGGHIYPRIDIMTADSFVLFEQKYYQYDTKLRVVCIAQAVPKAEVRILKRMPQTSYREWEIVPKQELTLLEGTFENGYEWDTRLEHNMDIKCEASRGTAVNSDIKRVRVASGEPSVNTNWTKNAEANGLEDPKQIYEGDTVSLICNVPKASDWTVNWIFKDKVLESYDADNSTYSTKLIAANKNVSVADSGDYKCLLTKDGRTKELKQIINVVKIVRPYHSKSPPDTNTILKFGSPQTFDCHMEGVPQPIFYWLKDEQPYNGGVLSNNNKTLTIPRVAQEDQGLFQCVAINRAGSSTFRIPTTVEGGPKRIGGVYIFLLTLLSLILLCCLAAAFVMYWKQRKRARQQEGELAALYEQLMRTSDGPLPQSGLKKIPLDQRIDDLPYNRQFELEKENLEIGNRIGSGQFGLVFMGWLAKARVSDPAAERVRLPVAVKAPLSGRNITHQKMLAEELKIMCAIGKHPNVLALVGAVTKNMKGGELYVVVEMCDNGNLKDYLLKFKNGKFIDELRPRPVNSNEGYLQPNSAVRTQYAAEQSETWATEAETDRLLPDVATLTTSDLISYGMQIANGMEYLASIPCIHRDLAARNVLLTKNKICRIADFGMARNENKNYYKLRKSKNVPVPYRWMSIEAIEDGFFTQESDVWSFGICLYEIFTLGGFPYPTIPNDDILEKLKAGHRNTKPAYCHEDIYEMMLKCWDRNTHDRPNFTQCLNHLKHHLNMASPQLLERVEKDIVKEGEQQNALSRWLPQEDDNREQARNGLARIQVSSPDPGERIYVKDFNNLEEV